MTQPAPAPFSTYDSIGQREDLSDLIYMISPYDTPFITGVPKVSATGVLHEWQTDILAVAAQNAQIEGDDVDTVVGVATTRLTNQSQIAFKAPRVTGTQEAVLKAGRRSEMKYQIRKRSLEIRRDMEFDVCANNAKAAGNDTTARELGGLGSWIATNTQFGTGGSASAGTGADATTDGTQRDFTEAMLLQASQECWDQGGDPDCLMVGSRNKRRVSTFMGNATRQKDAMDRRLVAVIDIYDSDFGEFEIIPNRFQPARSAFLIQKSMWAIAYLRPFRLTPLSKTGDTDRKLLITEYTIEARQEAASAAIYDLTTT